MRKIISILVVIFIAFTSCKKSSSSGSQQYHVSYTVNGVNKTYTGYVAAHLNSANSTISLTVFGADSDTSTTNYIGFYLDNYSGGGSIAAGQYVDTMTNYTLLGNYTANGIESDAGQSIASDAESNSITIANHFKVNITSITSAVISGTFSGDFYQYGDVTNGAKVTITNGEFYAMFQ